MEPFRPRLVRSHDVHARAGWRLKVYSITHDASVLDWTGFTPGLAHALAALPAPAVAEGRPGLGFVVAHHGRGADYVVLGWWDRENELPARVFVREQAPGASWRPAQASESFCVWDLELMWFEREAYVQTMLAGGSPDAEAYLGRRAGLPAEPVFVPPVAAPSPTPATGSIQWVDLTVPDATRVRDFYAAVTGWKPEDVPMAGYSDYNMTEPASGKPAAGVCHARGVNADLPAQWLMYVTVESLDQSLERCRALGGAVIAGPKGMGSWGRYAVIRDPAGAVAALMEPARSG